MVEVVEASIARLREAMEAGRATSVDLVIAYRARLAAYDAPGTPRALNSVVVHNQRALDEAAESDARRARGETLGPLDGIPYTAKDSYLVRGLTAAAGSPAFAGLVAQRDAFVIERLRAAGAICIGLTNMPPMANGGMQRGLYGRAESPYNAAYLTAPFGSGSSNGSGTSTAASFSAFGLGSETWSSGRGPASHNGLCAYTPTRGLISCRGLWPLVPTQDVPVPHTRTMADLLEVLDVVVADDPEPRGDFWRVQPWMDVPATSTLRPASYPSLGVSDADEASDVLRGKRLGVPRMYINADPVAGTADQPGIGGPTGHRITTRPSIIAVWERARAALEAAGATVVEVDFPAVSNYEGDRPGAPTISTRGLVPPAYLRREIVDLCAWAWDDFLRANGDPALDTLAEVDGTRIFPQPDGALPDRYDGFDDDIALYPEWVRQHPGATLDDMPELAAGLGGLETTRRIDLDEWMEHHGLAAVVMPTVADVAPADMDTNPASADIGWRNGVWVANGNLAIRHLGIPTVTVPMGLMADTEMPVGLTVAGRPHHDATLLRLGAALEAVLPARPVPSSTPPLEQPPPHEGPGSFPAGAVVGPHPPGALPTLRHRFTIRAEVGPYQRIAAQGDGELVFIPITGGTVTGGGLDGRVLPGGGDWAVFHDDHVTVEARYQFVTDAGMVVDVVNTGITHFVDDRREDVGYFATHPVFRCDGDPDLTRLVHLGWARSSDAATEIDIFEVLDPASDGRTASHQDPGPLPTNRRRPR